MPSLSLLTRFRASLREDAALQQQLQAVPLQARQELLLKMVQSNGDLVTVISEVQQALGSWESMLTQRIEVLSQLRTHAGHLLRLESWTLADVPDLEAFVWGLANADKTPLSDSTLSLESQSAVPVDPAVTHDSGAVPVVTDKAEYGVEGSLRSIHRSNEADSGAGPRPGAEEQTNIASNATLSGIAKGAGRPTPNKSPHAALNRRPQGHGSDRALTKNPVAPELLNLPTTTSILKAKMSGEPGRNTLPRAQLTGIPHGLPVNLPVRRVVTNPAPQEPMNEHGGGPVQHPRALTHSEASTKATIPDDPIPNDSVPNDSVPNESVPDESLSDEFVANELESNESNAEESSYGESGSNRFVSNEPNPDRSVNDESISDGQIGPTTHSQGETITIGDIPHKLVSVPKPNKQSSGPSVLMSVIEPHQREKMRDSLADWLMLAAADSSATKHALVYAYILSRRLVDSGAYPQELPTPVAIQASLPVLTVGQSARPSSLPIEALAQLLLEEQHEAESEAQALARMAIGLPLSLFAGVPTAMDWVVAAQDQIKAENVRKWYLASQNFWFAAQKPLTSSDVLDQASLELKRRSLQRDVVSHFDLAERTNITYAAAAKVQRRLFNRRFGGELRWIQTAISEGDDKRVRKWMASFNPDVLIDDTTQEINYFHDKVNYDARKKLTDLLVRLHDLCTQWCQTFQPAENTQRNLNALAEKYRSEFGRLTPSLRTEITYLAEKHRVAGFWLNRAFDQFNHQLGGGLHD